MQTIAERLKTAYDKIAKAEIEAARAPHSVKLLAVSKTKPVSDIKLAYEYGQRLFGENYIQEGVDKINELSNLTDIEWHLIGPIQSNKTRLVAENFDWVQSIDREKIARRLSEQRPSNKPPLQVCIQVNIDQEDSKSGVNIDGIPALIDSITAMENLNLRGLMAIPSPNKSVAEQEATLKKLADKFFAYNQKISGFDTLSVGMSNDMSLAIKHSSTMVRIGTAIFGARNKPKEK